MLMVYCVVNTSARKSSCLLRKKDWDSAPSSLAGTATVTFTITRKVVTVLTLSKDVCYDNVKFTGWHTGYPDTDATVDLQSLRTLRWEKDCPMFFLDFKHPDGRPLELSPRLLYYTIRYILCSHMKHQTTAQKGGGRWSRNGIRSHVRLRVWMVQFSPRNGTEITSLSMTKILSTHHHHHYQHRHPPSTIH